MTKRYGDRMVLDRVSLTVRPGEKVGIVGDNGSGRSTLLRLLAGQEPVDNGSLTVMAPGGIGHIRQTLDLPGSARVGDAVDHVLGELRDLEHRIRVTETTLGTAGTAEFDRYAALVAEFDARGGHGADRRVEMCLRRLGEHAPMDRERVLRTLSGGQRSRVALAAPLALAPELLLLDEPTNDLDDEAVAWLEGHLHRHRGTVIVATHDRAFLERVTETILEVDRFGGGVRPPQASRRLLVHVRRLPAKAHPMPADVLRNPSVPMPTVTSVPRSCPATATALPGRRCRPRCAAPMLRTVRCEAEAAEGSSSDAPSSG